MNKKHVEEKHRKKIIALLSPPPQYPILNHYLMAVCLVALLITVLLFVLHSLIAQRVIISYGWIALMSMLLVIIVSDSHDLEHYLHQVQWSTLLFFMCLFVMIGTMETLGLIGGIGELVLTIIDATEARFQPTVAIVLFVFVFGILSGVLDNIPLATMMLRILPHLHQSDHVHVPLVAMVMSLMFACGFGGNGTIIGSSANVVCTDVAAAHGHHISFMQFFA